MKPSELVQAMIDAGATMEACVIALRALEERDQADDERRAKAAERKRKSRARKDDGRDGHVTVTGQSQDTSPPPPEDKKVPDPKKTHTPSTPPKNPPTGVKKGSRLPDDWRPTEADLAWAESAYPGRDFDHETEKFRDHWRAASGQNAVKRDWSAAWKNWIRKAGDSGWMKVRDGPGLDQQRARRVFL